MELIFNISTWQECVFTNTICQFNLISLIQKLCEVGLRGGLFVSWKLKDNITTYGHWVTFKIVSKSVIFSLQTLKRSIFTFSLLNGILCVRILTSRVLLDIFSVISKTKRIFLFTSKEHIILKKDFCWITIIHFLKALVAILWIEVICH